MRRLIAAKQMSNDKRFYVRTRFNKAQYDYVAYGEQDTIKLVDKLANDGHDIVHITDDWYLIYIIGET